MSNKKSKEKRQKQIKKRQKQIAKLEKLKLEAIRLDTKLAEQRKANFVNLNIRNLRIFKNTCNFLAPFVIIGGLTVGSFALCNGGLPFHLDKIKKTKNYILEYQTSASVNIKESYRNKLEDFFNEIEFPSSELIIYTPWELKEGQYIRYKREYNIDKLNTLDLYNAVLDEDYKYIEKNLKEYKEEIQVSNRIDELEKNIYFIDATLHFEDKSDFIEYNETNLKNIIITISELIVGIGLGALIAKIRDFDYSYELSIVKRDYEHCIKDTKPTEDQLKKTNKKILSLSKQIRGNLNEK